MKDNDKLVSVFFFFLSRSHIRSFRFSAMSHSNLCSQTLYFASLYSCVFTLWFVSTVYLPALCSNQPKHWEGNWTCWRNWKSGIKNVFPFLIQPFGRSSSCEPKLLFQTMPILSLSPVRRGFAFLKGLSIAGVRRIRSQNRRSVRLSEESCIQLRYQRRWVKTTRPQCFRVVPPFPPR